MNYNIPSSCSKKFSNSIDFNDFNYEKSMKNNHSSEALFDKMLLPSANKKNLQLLDLKEEEKLHKNLKNYAMTSRNINKESLGFKLNEDEIFQKKPHKKNDQIPSLNYYFKPQSQNYSKYNNSIDKKHSISFFEPPRYNENNNKVLLQKPSEQDQFINDYIIKKYEIKDKGLENIIEEKEKKDNNFNELNLSNFFKK